MGIWGNKLSRVFPGGLAIKTLHFHHRGMGLIPAQGAKMLHGTNIPYAPWCSQTNKNKNKTHPPADSVQFSSVTQLCLTLCDPMDCSTPGFPVHQQLPDFTQTHVYQASDAIQLSHSLSSPSPPALNLSQHQGLFKWISFSHQGAKGLEFQP